MICLISRGSRLIETGGCVFRSLKIFVDDCGNGVASGPGTGMGAEILLQ